MKKPDYCPEWFDIDNYSVCSRYNRNNWAEALIVRQLLWKSINQKDDSNSDDKNKFIQEISQKKSLELLIYDSDEFDENFQHENKIVRNMSLFSFFQCYEKILNNEPWLIEEIQKATLDARLENENASEFERENTGHISWSDLGEIYYQGESSLNTLLTAKNLVGNYANDLIEVCLTESDDKILEAFKVWLSEKRIEKGFKKKDTKSISNAEMLKWHDLRILAFIDLTLWAELNKKYFTHNQLGNLLYPHEVDVDVTERVRKVVIPKVDWILKNKVILRI